MALISLFLPLAGMPSILPDSWEFETSLNQVILQRLDAISFFVAVFLFSTWGVQGLWNYLARDWQALPRITFARAFSLVLLMGMLFAVVLTMISGARELMTPGAWEKVGWTYKLSQPPK